MAIFLLFVVERTIVNIESTILNGHFLLLVTKVAAQHSPDTSGFAKPSVLKTERQLEQVNRLHPQISKESRKMKTDQPVRGPSFSNSL